MAKQKEEEEEKMKKKKEQTVEKTISQVLAAK